MQIVDVNGTNREAQSAAPDPAYPGFVRVEFKRHHEWMSYSEFLEKNPKLKHLIKSKASPPPDVVGVVTKSTHHTLTDSTKSWKKEVYPGMWVWISRGLGEGQKRKIRHNTKTTVTVDADWETKPDRTSQYVISYNVQDSVRAMGNTLPQADMKALEKRAMQMDKAHGRLTSDSLKKNIKYLKPEEI
ncbi:hypothetical protein A2W24_06555 [Microgenomates group bacterium RBG_16_45_19]|nr:MAG: hypothetical protein A2W24_06555 [Microgenomates group bacterium RBG_16_45_19]